MKRLELAEALDVVKPAISSSDTIKIFSHVCFNDDTITAYNDIIGIQKQIKTGVKGAIKGADIIGILSNSKAKELEFQSKGNELEMRAAKARIKFPVLPTSDFVFEIPDYKDNPSILLTARLLKGIGLCLNSVGADNTRPAMMGITFNVTNKKLTLYASDGVTISRFNHGAVKKAKDDAMFVAPTDFCKNALKLSSKVVGEESRLYYGKDHLVLKANGGVLMFSKIVGTKRPLDFEGVIQQSLPKKPEYIDFPKGFKGALKRSLVIQEDSRSSCQLMLTNDKITISTETGRGSLKDNVKLPASERSLTIKSDPQRICDGMEADGQITFGKVCVAIKNDDYLFMVANITD